MKKTKISHFLSKLLVLALLLGVFGTGAEASRRRVSVSVNTSGPWYYYKKATTVVKSTIISQTLREHTYYKSPERRESFQSDTDSYYHETGYSDLVKGLQVSTTLTFSGSISKEAKNIVNQLGLAASKTSSSSVTSTLPAEYASGYYAWSVRPVTIGVKDSYQTIFDSAGRRQVLSSGISYSQGITRLEYKWIRVGA